MVAKLLVLGALVAVAIAVEPGVRQARALAGGMSNPPLGFATLFAGVTLTLFAYGGWQQALWMAGR